jgi:urease gamma subunit
VAFADPQSVVIPVIGTVAPARTSSGANAGTFKTNDGNVTLDFGHIYGKRTRRTVRLTHRKVAADPLLTSQNLEYSMSAYLVVDVPKVGYTVAEAKQIVDGLVAYLTISTGANVTKLLGGEN